AEVCDGGPFERAEGGLAVLLEDLRDGPPDARFDALVEIDERRCVAARKAPPDDALATAGQSDPDDVHHRPQSSPPEPASSVPVNPWAVVGAAAVAWAALGLRPPATGASGVAAVRARHCAMADWISPTV